MLLVQIRKAIKKIVKDQLFTNGPLLAHHTLPIAITAPYVTKLSLIRSALWKTCGLSGTTVHVHRPKNIKEHNIFCILSNLSDITKTHKSLNIVFREDLVIR